LLQEVNSLGLNEQELLFLSFAHGNGPHPNYYQEIDGQPELFKVIDILEWILKEFGMRENSHSKLSRIHFHSLTFHVIGEIAAKADKQNELIWSNSVSSLMSGAKIASKQACGFDFNDEKHNEKLANLLKLKISHELDHTKQGNSVNFRLNDEQNTILKLNSSNPILEFNRGNLRFLFTPVLVCKKPVKTVGLGDAISSNGLLYSILNNN
jgi:ADP-dependent glucokinase